MILEQETTTTTQQWYGCYDGGWQGLITEQAFSHPAKFSRNLINRIYSYALERGWLKPGDTVLDCFGGVGLGALDAGANGLNWIGCELESRFTDLGQGCECTGISKADWVRFYGRWEKVNYKDGRHWCPQCLAEAKQVTDSRQFSLFEPEPSAAYTRNSGVIPETRPHYYRGNLDLFRKYAKPGTWAVLLNGDSRNLRSVIGQAQVDGLLSSPPYANGCAHTGGDDPNPKHIQGGKRGVYGANYSQAPDNLGNLPEGNLDALLSSPPYANSLNSEKNGIDWDKAKKDYPGRQMHEGRVEMMNRNHNERRYGPGGNGNLGGLSEGNLADSLLTSPPFAGNSGGRGEASRNGIDAALFDRHSGGMKKGTGENPANLDHLPMRGLTDALVTSPPFEKTEGFRDKEFSDQWGPKQSRTTTPAGYGTTAGQLGIEQGQTFWAAARQIVDESYLALKPGAYTFWVCKAFVRDGKRVDFPGQWQQLCEAVGFEYVETIRAMLVSKENEQKDLSGGGKVLRKEKKSFFRRLAEKNGSPRIDFEEVVILRKPLDKKGL